MNHAPTPKWTLRKVPMAMPILPPDPSFHGPLEPDMLKRVLVEPMRRMAPMKRSGSWVMVAPMVQNTMAAARKIRPPTRLAPL